MFGDRGLGWKLGAALAVALGLAFLSARRAGSTAPDLLGCKAQPARWDGTMLRIHSARVVESDTAGFEIESDGVSARVVPAAAVAPGDSIDLTGTFRAQGQFVHLTEVRKIGGLKGPARLLSLVPVMVLGGVLLNLLRHFTFRPQALQVGRSPGGPGEGPRTLDAGAPPGAA
ncbi:MAG TPA: hypothetical protein VEN81_03865 [Planctomycetota bacterium]|nr:hypothetical protein [Planctomycetota bacterium]